MHVFFYHPKDSKGQFIDGDRVIIFGSVRFLSKKYNQTGKKKTRNRTETGPNRPVSVWFFIQKTRKTCMHFLDFFGFISTVSPQKN
jgi:hypothetical protein